MLSPFDQRIALLRAGDPSVIQQFVSDYEPFLRRALRAKLTKAALRHAADSNDLSQSVLGSFLIRIRNGEFQITNENDLERLLITFANRKFIALARREYADKRDRKRVRRIKSDSVLVDPATNPEVTVEKQELIGEVHRRLSESDLQLFDLRQKGHSWEAIGKLLDRDAVQLRKQLSRALNRIAAEMAEDERNDG